MRPRLPETLVEILLGIVAFISILVTGVYFATDAMPAAAVPDPAPTRTVVRVVIEHPAPMPATRPAPKAVKPKPKPRLTPVALRPIRASRSVELVRMCILTRESHGDYRAVSRESYHGMHAYGGYQFQDPTWFHVTHLRGHASSYSKAVQDAAFIKLYANGKGRSNWYWRGHEQCW
jgi:hypothetical protein